MFSSVKHSTILLLTNIRNHKVVRTDLLSSYPYETWESSLHDSSRSIKIQNAATGVKDEVWEDKNGEEGANKREVCSRQPTVKYVAALHMSPTEVITMYTSLVQKVRKRLTTRTAIAICFFGKNERSWKFLLILPHVHPK
jgi:hypothetical protein